MARDRSWAGSQMGNPSRYMCHKRPLTQKSFFSFVSTLIVAAGLLSASPAWGQTYWLRYAMTVGSTDSDTQNNSYDSGEVQSTNLLTTTLIGSGSFASVNATPSASYGSLQLTAHCGVNDPTWDGNGHITRFVPTTFAFDGGPDVSFQDTVTITSATLPTGTPVQVQIVCLGAGYITPGAGSGNDNTQSSASVSLNVQGYAAVVDAISSVNQSNSLSTVVNTTVGSRFFFNPSLSASGWAEANSPPGFVGSVDTAITSLTYVEVLTAGAGYVADSGTVYPTMGLPTLTIQATGNTATISWSSLYANYALKQSATLDPASWGSNTNTVNQVGGRNQITVSPLTGAMFYRLQKQ